MQKIENGYCIYRHNGIYRKQPLFEYNNQLFTKVGGGFALVGERKLSVVSTTYYVVEVACPRPTRVGDFGWLHVGVE